MSVEWYFQYFDVLVPKPNLCCVHKRIWCLNVEGYPERFTAVITKLIRADLTGDTRPIHSGAENENGCGQLHDISEYRIQPKRKNIFGWRFKLRAITVRPVKDCSTLGPL